MRITGGELRGRRLHTPASKYLRPALERVREAIFNILGPRLDGARVLDSFAGTGLLGLECLSRGSAFVTFVELHKPTSRHLAALLPAWGLEERARLIVGDFLRVAPRLAEDGPYDVVFVDPPYPKGLIDRSLEIVAQCKLVAPDGRVVAKQHHKEALVAPVGLSIVDQRTYGDSKVTFLTARDTT
ncbi:MAG: 16S rRNA (guanine(966)-N(2))-methyltransferase RsmD [Candidatus Lernaella stagnicola]|nr:16S rRNA (guanine(966)-N(2))-methyltransferase RsmD [Candidatus Lernaella stagnicola]